MLVTYWLLVFSACWASFMLFEVKCHYVRVVAYTVMMDGGATKRQKSQGSQTEATFPSANVVFRLVCVTVWVCVLRGVVLDGLDRIPPHLVAVYSVTNSCVHFSLCTKTVPTSPYPHLSRATKKRKWKRKTELHHVSRSHPWHDSS